MHGAEFECQAGVDLLQLFVQRAEQLSLVVFEAVKPILVFRKPMPEIPEHVLSKKMPECIHDISKIVFWEIAG
jgi:hypothetical protein